MNPSVAFRDHALVRRLQCDHWAVRDALRTIENDFFSAAGSAPGRAHLVDALSALRERLELHFREEEQGGCREEAVCRRPSLAGEADRLEHERPDLLRRLTAIIGRLAHMRPRAAPEELKAAFDRFAGMLRVHEACEDRILERGLNVNMEVEDF